MEANPELVPKQPKQKWTRQKWGGENLMQDRANTFLSNTKYKKIENWYLERKSY